MVNGSANCFANAIIQCMMAVPDIVDFFVSGKAESGQGKPHRPFTTALSALVHDIRFGDALVSPCRYIYSDVHCFASVLLTAGCSSQRSPELADPPSGSSNKPSALLQPRSECVVQRLSLLETLYDHS